MSNKVSRRSFLRTSVALGAGLALAPRTFASSGSIRAYAGTYTGHDGRGAGIYLFDFDSATGALLNRRLAVATVSPSWIALDPSKRFLYAANELDKGAVTAFALDSATGTLRQLNSVSSHGASPCYLSFDASGRFALVANYSSGTVAVLPVHEDGSLGEATDVQVDAGVTGAPNGATNAPPGSFSSTGHDAPHAHCVVTDPNGKFILATDLGQDLIYVYRLDISGKLLALSEKAWGKLPTGDGPRHLAFHPSGRYLYSIQEQASTVALFHYDQDSGALALQQSISTLPEGFAGTSYGSEILVHPSGKWLYAANRLHDSIAAFGVATDGSLVRIGHTPTLGDYPRHLAFDPAGRYIFSSNQKGDSITSFRIHPQSGALAPTGNYAAVGTPACLVFA